ncbi:MAG: ABC transporter permease [Ignavibacteriales bacterium]|jgi:phospholipid/cholesterol/gamma-HCH transport system permease protein|nr:ABC transporter permease [Ignavibacteriota bacterium]MBW7841791.1 ABC transporter permease [Ignavibacterium sp.]MCO6446638.1 ABC transporter permease [Ignavibacterium album]MCZ2269139.1 ABC transporter permease [Ignavibacteriales bacterium]MDX9711263.1 ABC transporter permease [Ignavibacteriaceae bacterium]
MLAVTLQKIGSRTLNFFQEFGQISNLFWGIIKSFRQIPKSKSLILFQMEHIGVNSLPLVLIIAIFTGAVAAWQAAYQLKGIAPLSFLGGATTRAIITELGPVLTGIVIAGRVGASIAAELGTMKVTEQIDALETMAISPVRYLAMPRFLASVLMMPVLVVFANTIAVLGAYIVSNYFLGVSFAVFFNSVNRFFNFSDLISGLIKTVFFGGVTSLLGCHIGFKTTGGAEGVGLATIRSFVISAALILILDYVLWMLIF